MTLRTARQDTIPSVSLCLCGESDVYPRLRFAAFLREVFFAFSAS